VYAQIRLLSLASLCSTGRILDFHSPVFRDCLVPCLEVQPHVLEEGTGSGKVTYVKGRDLHGTNSISQGRENAVWVCIIFAAVWRV